MTKTIPSKAPNKHNKKGKKIGLWIHWYDKKWKETDQKDQVAYYREAHYHPGELAYNVKDYYRSGQIQFTGKILDFGEGVLMEACTWYFKNGKKKAEATYHYGGIEGIWKDYFNTGSIKTRAYYERGQRNGNCTHYYQNGKVKTAGKYYKEQKAGLWQKWDNEGKLQERLFYAYGKKLSSGQAIYEAIHTFLDRAQYFIALDVALENKKLTEEQKGKKHPYYLKSLDLLSWIYQSLGQYDQAELVLQELSTIVIQQFGKDHPAYIDVLFQLASFYWNQGIYTEAEVVYRKLFDLLKTQKGPTHPDMYIAIHNMGLLYKQLGDHVKAEEFYLKALKLKEAAFIHRSLGSLFRNNKQFDKAKIHLEKALALCPKSAPDYHYFLFNLGKLHRDQGNFNKAEKWFQQAVKKVERRYGKKNKDYASALYFLANNFRLSGALKKAAPLLKAVHSLQVKLLGENHIYPASTLFNLAQLYWASEQWEQSKQYFEKAIDQFLYQLQNVYPYVSEREKLEFWKNHEHVFESFYSFARATYAHFPNIAIKTLELSIATKGLALDSANLMRQQVIYSDSPDLYQQYQKWLHLKNELATSVESGKPQSATLKKLQEECDLLEKKLSRNSSKFIEKVQQPRLNWKDIQSQLQAEEAIIEFINFNARNTQGSFQTTFCLALIVIPEASHPILIDLGSTKEINTLLQLPFREGYVKNLATAQRLYNIIWLPLLPYLKGKSRIHYAPAGSLHQIAFSILTNQKGDALITNYSLHCYSTIRDYLPPIQLPENLPKTALLMGGIKYDLTPEEVVQFDHSHRGIDIEEEWEVTSTETLQFSYLNGTLKETKLLSNLLKGKKWQVQLYTGLDANEIALRKYSADQSPAILHLATHGYFSASNIISAHPLLRSGLALAGANDSKLKGILTALDVASFDLRNTQLVVLSACETGLGEINNHEGIFGLQRAFKLAGAKALLLSLWQIPDQQTVELMDLFYRHFLAGKDKADALISAQRQMKEKYAPFYWAGFVMVK